MGRSRALDVGRRPDLRDVRFLARAPTGLNDPFATLAKCSIATKLHVGGSVTRSLGPRWPRS